MRKVTINIPLHLPSSPNARMSVFANARRVSGQRRVVRQTLAANADKVPRDPLPVVVTMVDRSRRQKPDMDNVVSSFKAIRDEIAKYFGVNDADGKPIQWCYDQDKPLWRTSTEGKRVRYDSYEISIFYE